MMRRGLSGSVASLSFVSVLMVALAPLLALVATLVALAVVAAPALAATPPEAPETLPATAVTSEAAELHGILNPNQVGGPGTYELGTYQFLYKEGATCVGGTPAPVPPGVTLGEGHEEVPAEAISHLKTQTQYTACLSMTVKGVTTVGSAVTFVTGPPETPVEAKVKADSTTASSVEVEGVLNPGKAGEPGSSYEFLYKESGSECRITKEEEEKGVSQKEAGGAAQGQVKELVSAQITGLEPNAEYTFCLLVHNAAGEEPAVAAAPVTFSTHAAKPSIASESTNDVDETTATVIAKVNPEGLDTHVYVQYGSGQDTPPVDIGPVVGEQEVKFALIGLQPGTSYPFHVVAFNDDGTEEGEGSFNTPKTPPPAGESPWWQLTSVGRPGILPAGTAADEVQELVTVPGVVEGTPNRTDFVLQVEGQLGEEFDSTGQYGPVPDKASIQAFLEEAYGAGEVTVTEEPDPGRGAGAVRYLITGSRPKPVKPVLVHPEPTSEAEAKVLSEAKDSGSIAVTAVNLGDAATSKTACVRAKVKGTGNFNDAACTEANPGAGEYEVEQTPVTVVDTLPAGVEAVSVQGIEGISLKKNSGGQMHCEIPDPRHVLCTYAEAIAPYELAEVVIGVVVQQGASGENEVSASGGGTQPVSLSRPLKVAKAPGEVTPFGVEEYVVAPEEAGGALDTQAGSHPFQTTFSATLSQTAGGEPAALPKDLVAQLPPGLIGNPQIFKKCPLGKLFAEQCPAESVVGVIMVTTRVTALFEGVSPDAVGTLTAPIVELGTLAGGGRALRHEPAGDRPDLYRRDGSFGRGLRRDRRLDVD